MTKVVEKSITTPNVDNVAKANVVPISTTHRIINSQVSREDIINLTRTTPRIGVTDLQKDTRGWRRKLNKSGLIEITDRNSTAGYLVSVETIQQLAQDFEEQERLIEEQAIQAMFNARISSAERKSGTELAEDTKEVYKKRFGLVNHDSE